MRTYRPSNKTHPVIAKTPVFRFGRLVIPEQRLKSKRQRTKECNSRPCYKDREKITLQNSGEGSINLSISPAKSDFGSLNCSLTNNISMFGSQSNGELSANYQQFQEAINVDSVFKHIPAGMRDRSGSESSATGDTAARHNKRSRPDGSVEIVVGGKQTAED